MPDINIDQHKQIIKEITLMPERDVATRNFRAAGVISDLMEKSGCGKPVIVGGLSVEFYTDSSYTTQDIDVIGLTNERLYRLLRELGFNRSKGRHYANDEAKLFIEFPSGELDGSINKLLSYQTEDGFDINFIGIEDILVDRIRARVSAQEKMQHVWIVEMYQKYKNYLDLAYIETKLNTKEKDFFFNELIPRLEKTDSTSHYDYFLQLLEYEESSLLNETEKQPLFFYTDKEDDGWLIFNAPQQYDTALLVDGELEIPSTYFAISLDPVFHIVKMNQEGEKLDFYATDPYEGLNLIEGIAIIKKIATHGKEANNFPLLIELLEKTLTK